MNGDSDLIHYRIERSKQTLEDAEMLFDADRLNSAVNRLYYCMFYAVVALLKTKNLVSSKHSGVRALFNQHFVKTGIVAREIGAFYETIFNQRHESDYVDYSEFTREQVNDYLIKCKRHTKELHNTTETLLSNKDE